MQCNKDTLVFQDFYFIFRSKNISLNKSFLIYTAERWPPFSYPQKTLLIVYPSFFLAPVITIMRSILGMTSRLRVYALNSYNASDWNELWIFNDLKHIAVIHHENTCSIMNLITVIFNHFGAYASASFECSCERIHHTPFQSSYLNESFFEAMKIA